jgi:CRISPR-associated protein Csh2
MKHIQGTGAFASREGAKQTTFREEDILYYSLIAFHGIVNPTAAKDSQATEEDIKLLVEGMWQGTKNLISRSKFGHMPRLLLKINYNSPRFFIGDLDRHVSVKTDIPVERLRDISDLQLDVSSLKDSLSKHATNISSIEYVLDSRLNLVANGATTTVENFSGKITTCPITIS